MAVSEATIISAIGLIKLVVNTIENVQMGKLDDDEALALFEKSRPEWQTILNEWREATKE